jgi:hypothetical protein
MIAAMIGAALVSSALLRVQVNRLLQASAEAAADRGPALTLVAAVWAISVATIAARAGYSLPLDGNSVGVFATLVLAMLGCLVSALVREHRPLDASPRSR